MCGIGQRRERKAQAGELVQMDGSEHDWFEGRRPRAVLMVMIDDAMNRNFTVPAANSHNAHQPVITIKGTF